ncbi:PAN domain protein [Onchocerca flexuosa]|uniref:PAN domain protein n=1 Tax=Onchocerca flexuosa TaxID=387005 RepID=A0A238C1L1_9BILA|nr:PAN domain protein [Onchocerca flexuosa]
MVSCALLLLLLLLLTSCATISWAVFECGSHETTAFVRIARARLSGTPVVVSTAGHDLTCAQYCRNNIEPTTGAQRVCASFNFDGRETCYFFDDAATPAGTANLAPNPSANNFYYEKTCIPGVSAHEACTYRSFSFEHTRKTALEGFVRKSVQVGSREQCLSACLKEEEFVCRSVNYNYDTYLCELSTEDRRSKPSHLRHSDSPVDYYDNNCLSRQNRCGEAGGNLVFVKTTNFEIHFYDHTQSVEAQESFCLQKCLDSLNTFCRSVEFSPSEKNCIVSDEDTFSRADQQGHIQGKDYYEPVCVAGEFSNSFRKITADLSSSTCRQQAAFERFIGSQIEGQPVASAQGVTLSDCISLCFQNLNCKSINYDRTQMTCYVFSVGRSDASVKSNPSTDFYEFNCESPFGGMALCTNEGIRFIVNTKEPYTGAIYAAERFGTCSQVVENAKQISINFPPPTVSSDCGTVIKDGKLEALVVVSLDGVLPHQVTTEWDRFYRVSCDISMDKMMHEGSVVVTTIYDAGETNTRVLAVGTPPPVTATLSFLSADDEPLEKASIGDAIQMVVTSEQAGPHNMMLTECSATRVGGEGDAVPFLIIENGCPRYPALVGPIRQDFEKNRLKCDMKAFRLDGSYDVQILCQVMFCAGPNGCPPSNCLDSGTNELFMSHGRRKRNVDDSNQTEGTLSAIIRVLAEGEDEEVLQNATFSNSAFSEEFDLVCMSETWFISSVVSVSMVCLVLSAFIVVWGCSSLKKEKLPL